MSSLFFSVAFSVEQEPCSINPESPEWPPVVCFRDISVLIINFRLVSVAQKFVARGYAKLFATLGVLRFLDFSYLLNEGQGV